MKETRFPKDSDLTPAGVEAAQQFAVEWAASATGIPGGCPHAIRECSLKQGWSTLRVDRSIVDQPIVIAGRTFAHGLGTHADSEIVISANQPMD